MILKVMGNNLLFVFAPFKTLTFDTTVTKSVTGACERVWTVRSGGLLQARALGLRFERSLIVMHPLKRGGKDLDAVISRDLTKVASHSPWRMRVSEVSEVWQSQQYSSTVQRSSFHHPNNDQGR